ncbi:MAG: hypothetical protein H7Y38_12345 [Armatimonadetes bacterium]|nr:hypothetical protein [Armatimonadota bacterium]
MNINKIARVFAAGIAIIVAGGVLAPAASLAQTSKEKARQRDKNTTRNIAIGAGAAAVYEGVNKRGTNAAILGAGALYAGKKYEDARKAQTREKGTYKVYRYRNGKKVGYYQYVNNKRGAYRRI